MAAETTVGYTICQISDAPDAFGGQYPGAMRLLGVRMATGTARSVWNEGPEDATLVIASTRSEDPRDDVELVEDFWPAS